MADCHRAIGIGSAELVTHRLGDDVADTEEVVEAKGRRYEPLRELVVPFPRVDQLLAACPRAGAGRGAGDQRQKSTLEWMVPAIGGEDVVRREPPRRPTSSRPKPRAGPAADRRRGTTALDTERTVTVGDTTLGRSGRRGTRGCPASR
jgi:hypothetical protein